MKLEWPLQRAGLTHLCFIWVQPPGLVKMAIVLSNYLRSQKEKEHFDHNTDSPGVSEDKISHQLMSN